MGRDFLKMYFSCLGPKKTSLSEMIKKKHHKYKKIQYLTTQLKYFVSKKLRKV